MGILPYSKNASSYTKKLITLITHVNQHIHIDDRITIVNFIMSLVVRKPVFGISDQARHKPGGTATEDHKGLEISDLGSRGIVLSE